MEICEAREALGWTQIFVAEKAFADENPEKWDQYVRRIGDYETGKVKRPQVKVYQPLCDVLGITRHRIGELKAQAADTKTVSDDDIAALRAEKGSLEQALSDLRTLSRAQLESLATRFEFTRPYDATDGALIEFLTDKARDYRALKAQIGTIDGRSNIKAAAQDAYEAGDFEEVLNLLDQVHSDELEEAANTAVTRANSALMLNRAEQAFRILSAAAGSFAAVDPIEPARKRILTYFAILRGHGHTYGGTGIMRGIDLLIACLTDDLRKADPWLWAAGQNALAVGQQEQGIRTDGPAGADLLAQAVAAYRDALTVRTRDAHPVQWATTQMNLGNALQTQGSRTDGPAGADLLAQAVIAYRDALTIRTRDDHPEHWAATQSNLGNALRNQGNRADGPAGADLLAQTVSAYRDALTVYTRDAHPVRWATTQNNLAIALKDQGSRTDGPAGANLLAQAVSAYSKALTVRTRDAHPVHWATTQNNLAIALSEQGSRTDGPAGADLLAQAVAAYSKALTVFTRDAHPVDWAMTQNNLSETFEALAEHGTCDDPHKEMQEAIGHASAALDVFDAQTTGYFFDYVSKVKARIEAKIAALDTP